jgi:hypothetical protein
MTLSWWRNVLLLSGIIHIYISLLIPIPVDPNNDETCQLVCYVHANAPKFQQVRSTYFHVIKRKVPG